MSEFDDKQHIDRKLMKWRKLVWRLELEGRGIIFAPWTHLAKHLICIVIIFTRDLDIKKLENNNYVKS